MMIDQDDENLQIILHRIKGVASNIGAEQLSAVAQKFETVVREDNSKQSESLFLQLIEELERILKTAQRISGKPLI